MKYFLWVMLPKVVVLLLNVISGVSQRSTATKRVDVVNSKVSYVAVFEQYINKQKSFKAAFDEVLQESPANLYGAYNDRISCDQFYSIQSLDQPNNLETTLQVPKIAVNNYLRPSRYPEGALAVNNMEYFDRWPAFQSLNVGSSTAAFQCPANMHMLAWHYGSETSIIRATMHSKDHYRKVNRNMFCEGIRDIHDVYESGGSYIPEPLESVDLQSATMGQSGEYLFVPSKHLASFNCMNDNDPCMLATLCFVDASNLNMFREALALSCSEDCHLLDAVTAVNFDTHLLKTPSDMTVSTYSAFNTVVGKEEEIVPVSAGNRKDRRKRASSDFKDWQALSKWNTLVISLTLPKPSVPWVQSVQRDGAIVSWSSTFTPAVTDKTSFGFWLLACEVDEVSASQSDENEVCVVHRALRDEAGDTALQELLDTHVLHRTGEEKLRFQASIRGLRPSTQYRLRAGVLYGEARSPLSKESTVFRTAPLSVPIHLDPSVRFQSSAWTLRDPLDGSELRRATGELIFRWPEDDGGLPIIGFHVYSKSATVVATADEEEQTRSLAGTHWEWIGAHSATPMSQQTTPAEGRITLSNLVPLRTYQFQVAAYNALGAAPPSPPSNMAMINIEDHHTIHGWGHENYLGDLTQDYIANLLDNLQVSERESVHAVGAALLKKHNFTHPALASDEGCSLDQVALNMDRETMSVHSSGQSCPSAITQDYLLWRSHWTHPEISVVARAALTDSLVQRDVDTLKGRIAFVPRGNIPFTEKAILAQNAGAIALVVVDDGRCESYDQRCLPGANREQGEGFAVEDVPAHWYKVRIPVVFIMKQYFLNWLVEGGLSQHSANLTENDEL